ncbi:hypothetical protein Hokovirus_2_207 [Hokovirus HKV1]|uniref:Uncharacterized protein n=1 Tax=Hokovirus HKV1 TaxID=1977638 RepID=A0A1V0SG31_9VIRU|nr:hypothetical protein Hokovirus_2_207 [Hokovirus HKV1]
MDNNLDLESIKFLDKLIDYLIKGILPDIKCKNIMIIKNMFSFLNMKQIYINYLIINFNNKKRNDYRLTLISNLASCNKIRGEAEYFSLCNGKKCIYFAIGPYSRPIILLKC